MSYRSRVASVLLASLLLVTAAEAAITERLSRSFNVAEGGTLALSTSVGSIEIIPSNTSTLKVDVTRTARTASADRAREIFAEMPIEYSQSGNDVRITARRRSGLDLLSFWGNKMTARFVVTVPSRYNVVLQTSGGNIKVADIDGRVKSHTSGGNIDLGRVAGAVEAVTSGGNVSLTSGGREVLLKTSGGDISIAQAGDRLEAFTSGGSIDIGTVRGSVVAKTSGGNISAREIYGQIDAVTSGGNVTARIGQQPAGPSRLSTSGGNVVVTLAGTISVEVDAETSGGSVTSEMPITMSGRMDRKSIHGKINSGGPKLLLRSSGGDIRLLKM